MNFDVYITLGRTGLRVSPLCLGTMTFGTAWGFGAEENVSREMFNRYIDAGGNFVDTADGYNSGQSEEQTGKFIAERNLRDFVALATKFTFNNNAPGNPNGGGNGRKNIYRALEGSLRRLKVDYIDLYYLHAWDVVTPVEEVVETLTDLVREGKIRYYGFSDTPAWYVARAQTIAELQGKIGIATLQLEYSLIERGIEREHIPVAQQLGIGVCPWSPLGGGFLTGKYTREGQANARGDGRLTAPGAIPFFNRFQDRNWPILEALLAVSKKLGKPPAQVALNWVATQPGVTSTILGARTSAQFDDNLAAIAFEIPADLRKQLNEASAIEPGHPYVFYTPMLQSRIAGGTAVHPWQPAFTYERPAAEKKFAASSD
jgi:aryl-alcohol dehydrogenase-like predicted oxidoreductase